MKKTRSINGVKYSILLTPSKTDNYQGVSVYKTGEQSPLFGTRLNASADFKTEVLPWVISRIEKMFPDTNAVILHALNLWPENETKPEFKQYKKDEWGCFDKHTLTHAPTMVEALYHFAKLSQDAAGQIIPSSDFGPVVDYLGEFVKDPLILE